MNLRTEIAAVSGSDWTPVRPWAIPAGITLRTFEILYMDKQGFHTFLLPAPSMNLAIRRFIRLDFGCLWQVREMPGKADA